MEVPIEALLADTAWLRRLTLQLAGNVDGASDLEQDVAMAALRTDSRMVSRAWFVAVARRLWALRLRRGRREARRLALLEPGDDSPGAADLVAEAELQRRAVDAVLQLPPHYRTTILLRFLRGLSVEATAAQLGIGVDTVRTRQKRALRQLRTQLMPRRDLAARIGLPIGGILMSSSKSAVAAIAVAALVFLGWLGWHESPTPPPADVAPQLAAVAATPPQQDLAPAPRETATDGANASRQPAADDTPDPPTPTARRAATVPSGGILVTVLGADGQPAGEGHAILCRASAGPGQVVVSDAASLARFPDLPAGRYLLGTADLHQQRAEVTVGATAMVTMRVASGKRIAGRVLDADGRAVPFAAILMQHGSAWPAWPFPVGRADASGGFEIATAAPLQMLFATDTRLGTTQGRLLREQDLTAEPTTVVELRFPGGELAEIRGRVADAQGTPIARAWVQVNAAAAMGNGLQGTSRPATLCTTDADGSFTASGLPVGNCRLYVSAGGFSAHTQQIELAATSPTEIAVVLVRGATVRGIVRGPDGRAIAGAHVEAAGRFYPQKSHDQTDAEGRFVFEDVAAGTCRIAAWQPQLPRVRREIEVRGPSEHELEFVLGDAVADVATTIRGRLLDGRGQSLANWFVTRTGGARWTATDADGRFSLVECAPEHNELQVRPNQPATMTYATFPDLRPGPDEQSFTIGDDCMPNATVRGHVLDASGRAVVGAQLQLTRNGVAMRQPSRTQADGTFELGPLPPGKYHVQPLLDGQQWAPMPFELTAYQQLLLVPLTAQQ